MTPKARTTTPPTPSPPPTCTFPVGGKDPCGAEAAWHAPWRLLYGYEDRTDELVLCGLHAARFPQSAPLP